MAKLEDYIAADKKVQNLQAKLEKQQQEVKQTRKKLKEAQGEAEVKYLRKYYSKHQISKDAVGEEKMEGFVKQSETPNQSFRSDKHSSSLTAEPTQTRAQNGYRSVSDNGARPTS